MQKKHLIKPSPIYDKNSQQCGNKGNIPKHNTGHIWQTHCQHHTELAKTTSICIKIGNKTGMSTFTSLIQHRTGSPGHSNLTRRNKSHPNWKRSKTVICRWHGTIHRKPLRFHQETTRADKWFQQGSRMQINVQKSVAFLFVSNQLWEREIKKTIPFTSASKR